MTTVDEFAEQVRETQTAARMAALKSLQCGDVLVEEYGTESVGRFIRVVASVSGGSVEFSAVLHVGCSGAFYSATAGSAASFEYLDSLNLRVLRNGEGAI